MWRSILTDGPVVRSCEVRAEQRLWATATLPGTLPQVINVVDPGNRNRDVPRTGSPAGWPERRPCRRRGGRH